MGSRKAQGQVGCRHGKGLPPIVPVLDGGFLGGGGGGAAGTGRVDGGVEGDVLRVPVLVLRLPHHPLPRVLVQLLVRRDAVLLRPTGIARYRLGFSSSRGDQSTADHIQQPHMLVKVSACVRTTN